MVCYSCSTRKPQYSDPKERRLDYTGEGINTFSNRYHSFLPDRPEYLGYGNMKKYQF